MLDKTPSNETKERTPTGTQFPILPQSEKVSASKSLWRRRSVQAPVGMIIVGGIVFVFWSWPRLNQLPANTTPLAYGFVLAPTGASILAVLLFFFVWWYLDDYGWLESFQIFLKNWKSAPGNLQTRQRFARPIVAKSATSGTSGGHRQRRVRHTTATQLRRRRTLHLYQGRRYLGSSKQDLSHLGITLSLSSFAPSKPGMASNDVGVSPEEGDQQAAALLAASYISEEKRLSSISPLVRDDPPQTPISISMLKDFVVEVQNKDGVKKTVSLLRKRRGDDRYTERDLLAFLAALRGQRIGRLKLLEGVFGYGLPNRNRQPEALRNQLNKATQFLRQDINEVASSLGLPDFKVIASGHDEWYLLTSECRVVDLDAIDQYYSVLDGISAQRAMEAPAQEACEALIKLYKGSFMESYIEEAVRAGSDEWDANWMRQPYTEYLRKYLLAVWYRAEYWRLQADALGPVDGPGLTLQRGYYETAAKLYEDYVYHAVPGFDDQSAMAFALGVETIASQAERALRSCLDMYTATGNTQAGEPVFRTFCNRMVDLWSFIGDDSDREWQPRRDTLEAWKNLKAQTKAHRKAGSATPHDLPRDEVRHAN